MTCTIFLKYANHTAYNLWNAYRTGFCHSEMLTIAYYINELIKIPNLVIWVTVHILWLGAFHISIMRH